jgi:inositol-hexakisphosphate 5-kinase
MTSIHHPINTFPQPPFTDISPPNSPSSLPNSPNPLHFERPISDPSPSEPLVLTPLSQTIHHPKSDADLTLLDSASLNANPFTPPSRPHFSPRDSTLRSHALHVIQSTHSGLTFPTSPRRMSKPLSRRRSTRSTASSSSDSSPPSSVNRSPLHSTAGIGRKVADSLQLFKESVSLPATEIINPLAFARTCSPSRRRISSHSSADDDLDVIGPHFEFVKRSDWQEREAAALRREQCTFALDRARTRESEPRRKERADPPRDVGHDDRMVYTKDLVKQQDSRGRPRDRRQRLEQTNVPRSPINQPLSPVPSYHDLCLTPVVTSLSYPSLSYSPPAASEHISLPVPQFQPPTILSSASIANNARSPEFSHSRSPTPVRPGPESPSRLVYPDSVSTPSPWTTDDESAWESASATSTSTSSPTSPLEPPDSNPSVTWPTDDEYHDLSSHTSVAEDVGIDDPYHTRFDSAEDVLPHIPLRPFRNQVGGHTSIYKFTKRAVCKVRMAHRHSSLHIYDIYLKHKASRFKGESILRGC